MADQHYNVYDAPRSPLEGGGRAGEISVGIIEQLRGTGGWVRFISILLFIFAALTLLGGIFTIGAGMYFSSEQYEMMGGGPASAALIGVNLVSTAVYLFLGIYLFRYASAIKRSITTNDSDDVELAMSHQRFFWRLFGILALIFVILVVGVILLMVIGLAIPGIAALL